MKRISFLLTSRQWRGVLILLLLLLFTGAGWYFLPHSEQPAPPATDTLSISTHQFPIRQRRYRHKLPPIQRTLFNPNTADSITLLQQGLRPWQVHNLLRYRAAGGKWNTRHDLKRLYGMNDSLYQLIQPYIDLPDSLTPFAHDTTVLDTIYPTINKRDTIVCINAADSATLCLIRGVGPFIAQQIIRYRQLLGGYYNVQQICEIPSLQRYAISYDSILPHLTVCSDSIHPIPVNRASLRQLMKHPYIRFEQAQQLYQRRREQIRLHDISDLDGLSTWTENDKNRIKVYLSFEE